MKREESSQSGCEVSCLCTGFVADYYIFHQREINCERFEPRKRSAFSFLCRCHCVFDLLSVRQRY